MALFVEITLLLQNLIRLLYFATIQDFIYERVCSSNLGHCETTCAAILNQGNDGVVEEYIQVRKELQRQVGSILIWRTALETAFPMYLTLVIGAWSDKYGRKYVMLINVFGCFLESLTLVLCSISPFKSIAGGWSVAALSTISSGMTGGFFCFKTSIFNYISDTTSLAQRTHRLGLLNLYLIGGKILGLLLAGKCANSGLGFGMKFGMIALFEAILFAFIYLGVKWTTSAEKYYSGKGPQTRRMVLDLLDLTQAKESIGTFLKRRAGDLNKTFAKLILIHCCVNFANAGEPSVIYLFARYQLNWNSGDISYFLTYKVILGFIGNMCAVLFLGKVLKLSDNIIGLVSCLSGILSSFIMANGTYNSLLFGSMIGMLISAASVIPRAKISKIIPSEEMGRIGSVLAGLDCFNLLMSEMLYTFVYKWTFESFPGAYFILSALVMIPPCIVFFKERNHNKQ